MADDHEFLAPLVEALRDLVSWWKSQHTAGLIIGGVAASLLGRPRATRDIDGVILLSEQDWPLFLASAVGFRFVPRAKDALEFARDTRMLLLTHSRSQIEVDIAFGALPFEEEAIARVRFSEAGGVRLPLPTPEDLIIMKAIAGRPHDFSDIEGILDAQSNLDLRRVRRWVGTLAELTERPEIVEELEKRLAYRRSQRTKRRRK